MDYRVHLHKITNPRITTLSLLIISHSDLDGRTEHSIRSAVKRKTGGEGGGTGRGEEGRKRGNGGGEDGIREREEDHSQPFFYGRTDY